VFRILGKYIQKIYNEKYIFFGVSVGGPQRNFSIDFKFGRVVVNIKMGNVHKMKAYCIFIAA